MKDKHSLLGALRRADTWFERITVYLSWISVLCLVIMGLLAVVDVVMANTIKRGIPIQKEIIEQFMVPVFILFVANIQLTGGLMSVDIFSKHYGPIMKKVIDTFTCVLGTLIMAFAGNRVFSLFTDYLHRQTRATTMMSSIKIWPYALILSLGLFSLALAYVWTIVRIYAMPNKLAPAASEPETESTQEGGDAV